MKLAHAFFFAMSFGVALGDGRALTWNGWLAQAADAHSRDMAQRNYFSHGSRDGRNLKDRVEAAGYVWRAIGENIAAGAPSLPVVMAGWQRSDEHCANLMNPEFTEVGLACMPANAAADYKTYWTPVIPACRSA